VEAITTALAEWSSGVDKAVQQQQQQQQQGGRKQLQDAQLIGTALELHENGRWLLTAAGCLLCCMVENGLYTMIDKRRLLATLGRLLQRVHRCDHNSCLPLSSCSLAQHHVCM
jgi:hypothetical protein